MPASSLPAAFRSAGRDDGSPRAPRGGQDRGGEVRCGLAVADSQRPPPACSSALSLPLGWTRTRLCHCSARASEGALPVSCSLPGSPASRHGRGGVPAQPVLQC